MEIPKIDLSENNKRVIIGGLALVAVIFLLFMFKGGDEVPPSAFVNLEEARETAKKDVTPAAAETPTLTPEEPLIRDPLMAPTEIGSVTDLVESEDMPVGTPYLLWQGVLLGPDDVKGAIINDKICREGEIVDGVKVVSIEKDIITVQYDGASYSLQMGVAIGDQEAAGGPK